jgi:hypothetical protein
MNDILNTFLWYQQIDSDFEPYLTRIDEISHQADTISNIVTDLDEYTKNLGNKKKVNAHDYTMVNLY